MDDLISQKLDTFFKQFKQQAYKKGEILIRADDEPSGVFYLVSGFIKEYAISKKGEELVLNIFKPVSFFPMSWAINRTPNAYYYEALEDTVTWKAPREQVIGFIKKNPDVLFNLMSRVYKGTDGILMRMVYLMSGEAYARVIMELLITAKRFGKFINSPGSVSRQSENKSVQLNVSEKEIANQAGMARETVSREIKILKDKGLVSFYKNTLIIENVDSLENELT